MSSDEKLKYEILAKRKRLDAIQYLKTQGQDISTGNESLPQKKITNRDNTLELLLNEKANSAIKLNKIIESNAKNTLIKQQEDLRTSIEASSQELPANWQKVLDPSSGLYYYWNTVTNKTTWEKPDTVVVKIDTSNEVLPSDWEKTIHPATKQPIYVNRVTGEKRSSLQASTNQTPDHVKTESIKHTQVKKDSLTTKPAIGKTTNRNIDPLDRGRVSILCYNEQYLHQHLIAVYCVPIGILSYKYCLSLYNSTLNSENYRYFIFCPIYNE